MAVFWGIEGIQGKLKNPVLTIGNFDGVHKGHLALFEIVKGKARDINGQSVVLTFDPHPMKVLVPDKAPELLLTTEEKIQLIQKAGIDVVVCEKFTWEFSRMGAREFVDEVLVKAFGVKEVVVGYDYSFGRNREGSIDLLKELAHKRGFKVYVLQPVNINGRLASSTAIRNFLKEGNIKAANELLGYNYTLKGMVVKGKGRGKSLLGIPTANLEIKDRLIPRRGVYATFSHLKNFKYPSVTNIGINPTFNNGTFSIETHIMDFYSDLLGENLEIELIQFIRDEIKFQDIQQLKDSIMKDIDMARNILSSSP